MQERACDSWTRYVLLGYSQGARIVGDLAAEIDRGELGTDLAGRVQVRLYADPRQPETGIGVALAGEKALDGVTFTGERAPFRLVEVEWICAPTDGVCDARGSRSGRNPSSATWPRIPVTGRHIFPTVGKVDD
ncbi:PE-PPE domain-containing protein [Rhodococcus qingshengii]|uniref:PE-PPE domain-containing protein n=1 Tax=Rhodococcus qingshengii TaxID=334542 RepID=UPI00287F99C1|nr:PE-PPE domain-containing protein [Rhodococcus qingshengii]